MRIIGNLIWGIFGGFEAAIGYFLGSLGLMVTIIGIPFGIQTFKIGMMCFWPFGHEIREKENASGCLNFVLNFIWVITGGFWSWCMHILFGCLLFITIIGIPFAKQHFKMSKIALAPFGKEIVKSEDSKNIEATKESEE